MARSRLQRPPAQFRVEPVIQPDYTNPRVPLSVRGFTYHTQYVVNVNPVHEPPRNDVPSLRQPISVAGWGRYVRTHMSTPILQRGAMDRVAHVGHMVGHSSERDRMRGALNRGYTYSSPSPDLGPGTGRVQAIGQGGSGGSRRRA